MIRKMSALGLTLLFLSLTALEPSKDLPIPQANHLSKQRLSDHITVYTQNCISSALWASFNVVFKYSSLEHTVYTFDSKIEDWDSTEDFLFACSEKAQQGLRFLEDSASKELPQEIAIVAIGDFSSADMLNLIHAHFDPIQLSASTDDRDIYIEQSDELRPSHVAISVTLPNSYPPLKTFSDLQECWKAILLQELLQQRFEECIRGLDEVWIHPHPQQFYPVSGFALVPEDEAENTLAFFLWHLNMLRHQGFYSDAFVSKKRQLLHKLHYLAAQNDSPSPALLSAYYKDQFLLGGYAHEYTDFLNASIQLIQAIRFEDLLPLLDSFLDTQHHKIHLIYPSSFRLPAFTPKRVQDLQEQIDYLARLYLENEGLDSDPFLEEDDTLFSSLKAVPIARDWIHRVNHETEELYWNEQGFYSTEPFYKLPISEKEKEIITFIISTIAKDNLIQLAFNRRSIEKKGKKIEHVHPLRFMGHIMSHRSLKDHVRTIKRSSFKWDAFIDGFSKRMKEEYGKNNIYPHIAGFAQLVGSTPEHILPYIHKKDWEGLVKSLL